MVTGNYTPIKNTLFDFSKERILKDSILDREVRKRTEGLDHSYVFKNEKVTHLRYEDKHLNVTSTYPGTQLYSMNFPINQPLLNRVFQPHMAIAIEHQKDPNAINHPHLSNVILRKNEEYNEEVIFEVYEEDIA